MADLHPALALWTDEELAIALRKQEAHVTKWPLQERDIALYTLVVVQEWKDDGRGGLMKESYAYHLGHLRAEAAKRGLKAA